MTEITQNSSKEAQAAFIKAVAAKVFVMLLPTITEIIKTASNSEITDERLAALSPKDPMSFFPCLEDSEDNTK